jgi:hypothetical protein
MKIDSDGRILAGVAILLSLLVVLSFEFGWIG